MNTNIQFYKKLIIPSKEDLFILSIRMVKDSILDYSTKLSNQEKNTDSYKYILEQYRKISKIFLDLEKRKTKNSILINVWKSSIGSHVIEHNSNYFNLIKENIGYNLELNGFTFYHKIIYSKNSFFNKFSSHIPNEIYEFWKSYPDGVIII